MIRPNGKQQYREGSRKNLLVKNEGDGQNPVIYGGG